MGTVTSIATRPSERAAERLRKQERELIQDAIQYCVDFAKEWYALNKTEQEHLSELLGKPVNRCQKIAAAGRAYPKKQKVMLDSASTPLALPNSVETIIEISSLENRDLRKLTKQGWFEQERTIREIRSKRKSLIVSRNIPKENKTQKTVDQIVNAFNEAADSIGHAATQLIMGLELMEENQMSSAKGLPIDKMKRNFRKLCAAMMRGNPEFADEAIKIFRGEK